MLLRGAVLPPSANQAIGITTPLQYQCIQRSGETGSITVTGTSSGLPSGGIEASFNGGAYQPISAFPGGSWTGTLTGQAPGRGTLTVRAVGNTAISATRADVSLGDIYIVAGDSNHSGRAGSSGTYLPSTSNGLVASLYGNDGLWKPMQENRASATGAFDDPASSVYPVADDTSARGSYFGWLGKIIMDATSIPVAFVPCALGGTNASNWQRSTSTTTLYGAALARAQAVGTHQAMLFTVGTNDAMSGGSLITNFSDRLTNTVQGWLADTGRKVVVVVINKAGIDDPADADSIRAIQQAVIDANASACIQGPDYDGLWTDVHYGNATQCEAVATAMFNALNSAIYGV
jgi:hypothetical protein